MNKKILPKIIFFGSGPVALESLKSVCDISKVEFVVTKASLGKNDSRLLVPKWAKNRGLEVMEVSSAKELDELIKRTDLESNLGVVVDFGIIIPKSVIDKFSKGIINSHFSLLPKWRGADPITWSLLEGDAETGVSLMKIVPRLDEGDLIAVEKIDIDPNDDNVSLTNRLINLSNQTLRSYLPKYIDGLIKPWPQPVDTVKPTYSSKISKTDGKIDWSLPADNIERQIRAFKGWPGSQALIANTQVTITKADAVDIQHSHKPGMIEVRRKPASLRVACGQGWLNVIRLKPSGKNEIDSAAFINGYAKHLFEN